MRVFTPPPAASLLAAALVGLAIVIGAVFAATEAPWLGLKLSADGDRVAIAAADPAGPLASASGALAAVGTVRLLPTDIVEEPDFLPDYPATEVFLERQTRLRDALAERPARLTLRDGAGREQTLRRDLGARPLSSLPLPFWVQLVCGVGGMLVGAWIWALRPKDLSAFLFFLTGLGMFASSASAAVYSGRELAIDGGLFRILSAINHLGAMGFGVAMIGLFLVYPRRLAPNWVLGLIGSAFSVWLALDIAHVVPNVQLGLSGIVMTEMTLIVACVIAQFFATRRDPVGRTALRWLGLSVVLGSGAFVLTTTLPPALGQPPLISQAYAFVFFFLIYVALGLGLRRSRVFQLDEWAFRLAFYGGAALALFVIDAVALFVLHLGAGTALGASLLLVAVVYLPLRDWLWRRMISRRKLDNEELFGRIVETALASTAAQGEARWRALLVSLFDPLKIEVSAQSPSAVRILDDGLALALPATAASPALSLHAPWGGRGLFGPSHRKLAQRTLDFIARTETSRDAYARGADEERRRIAQDLHDDVGSRLLSALHKSDLSGARQMIREAMDDVRVVAAQLAGERRSVDDLVADLRHESTERLEAAGLTVDWPLPEDENDAPLEASVYKAVRSSMRELVSNIIRHAKARTVSVRTRTDGAAIVIDIADDGQGMGEPGKGLGLRNIATRLTAVSGTVDFPAHAQGVRAVIRFPVR